MILSGEVCIIDVLTDEPTYLVRLRGGQFTGDIDLFTGRRAAASCEAISQVEAIRISPDKVREMLCASRPWARVFGERSAPARVADGDGFPGAECIRG